MSLRSRLLYFVFPSLLAMFIFLYLAVSYIVEREVSLDAELLADQHLEAVRMLHAEHVKVLVMRVKYMAEVTMLKALLAEHAKEKLHAFLEQTFKLPAGVFYAIYDENNTLLDASSNLFLQDIPICTLTSARHCEQMVEIKQHFYQMIEVQVKSQTLVWGRLVVAFELNDQLLHELQDMTEFCDISLLNFDGTSIFSSTLGQRGREDFLDVMHRINLDKNDLDVLESMPSVLLDDIPYVLRGFSLNNLGDHHVGYLFIHQSLESVDTILDRVGSFFAWVGFVLLLLIFFIDVILVKSVLRPLNNLVEAISNIGVDAKKLAIVSSNTQEISYLTMAINRMLQTIFDKNEQLIRSEGQFRNLITHANDAIISVDQNQYVCVWNQQAEHLFGYTEAEAMGLNIVTVFPQCPSVMRETQCYAQGKCKDGKNVSVEVTVSESMSMEDQSLYTAVIRDLSAEIQARERDQLLLQAIHHSSDMIMISDCNAVIEYVNPSMEKVTGYSLAELKGQTTDIFNSDKQPEDFYQNMWKTIRNGQVWQGRLINKRKNGELYSEEMSISPVLDVNNNISHFVAIKRDVSEQENIAEQIEHSQRLESLGVLAGGIAHDFNNLLTAIMGTASLLHFQFEEGSEESVMLDRIEQSSQRAADLCKQMLAYSGKGKFEIVPVNLSELTASLVELLHVSIEKHVHMQLELAEDLPFIDADVSQIQQIVMNLVINASESVDKSHGFIRVETGVVYANKQMLNDMWLDECLKEGRYVYLDVADNGCGMSEDVQKRIFDPFFTTKFTGRGLGMSAILGIVRGHKGAIRVQSEVGIGSTFTVLLPVQEVILKPIEKEKNSKSALWQGSGTILLVDDEAVIRKVVTAMLENMGFDVVVACNGQQALEQYKQHRSVICMVLLDLTMPVMDGIRCFKELRLMDQDIKVLISSGYSSQEVGGIINDDAQAGFIQKPYIMNALRDKLQHFFEEDESTGLL